MFLINAAIECKVRLIDFDPTLKYANVVIINLCQFCILIKDMHSNL